MYHFVENHSRLVFLRLCYTNSPILLCHIHIIYKHDINSDYLLGMLLCVTKDLSHRSGLICHIGQDLQQRSGFVTIVRYCRQGSQRHIIYKHDIRFAAIGQDALV